MGAPLADGTNPTAESRLETRPPTLPRGDDGAPVVAALFTGAVEAGATSGPTKPAWAFSSPVFDVAAETLEVGFVLSVCVLGAGWVVSGLTANDALGVGAEGLPAVGGFADDDSPSAAETETASVGSVDVDTVDFGRPGECDDPLKPEDLTDLAGYWAAGDA